MPDTTQTPLTNAEKQARFRQKRDARLRRLEEEHTLNVEAAIERLRASKPAPAPAPADAQNAPLDVPSDAASDAGHAPLDAPLDAALDVPSDDAERVAAVSLRAHGRHWAAARAKWEMLDHLDRRWEHVMDDIDDPDDPVHAPECVLTNAIDLYRTGIGECELIEVTGNEREALLAYLFGDRTFDPGRQGLEHFIAGAVEFYHEVKGRI
jgi:hypothetical protein